MKRKRGAQKGNSNALKHGGYTREAKAHQKHLRQLLAEIARALEAVKPFICQDNPLKGEGEGG